MSLLSEVVADPKFEQLSDLFKLLADRTRLTILLTLAKGERNVTSLCEQLGLPQPTVSHHLGLLRVNNVIANRRRGKQVFYSFNGSAESPINKSLEIAIEKFVVKIQEKEVP